MGEATRRQNPLTRPEIPSATQILFLLASAPAPCMAATMDGLWLASLGFPLPDSLAVLVTESVALPAQEQWPDLSR